jgi:hypothetical protein
MDITIKDLIEYLEKFPKEMKVYLNYDGWLQEEGETDPQKVIDNRGLFSPFKGEMYINN